MPSMPPINDSLDETVHAALREELGLSDSPSENVQRMDAAVAFLHSVQQARQKHESATAHSAARRMPELQRFIASSWSWLSERALRSNNRSFGPIYLFVAVAVLGAAFWRFSAFDDAQTAESHWRSVFDNGEVSEATWRTPLPKTDAAAIAAKLRAQGCFAEVNQASAEVTLYVDTSPPKCVDPEALLSPLGLVVDLHGKLRVRVLVDLPAQ